MAPASPVRGRGTRVDRFQAALRTLPSNMSRVGANWALVGGMAVSARSVARFTSDFDVAVAVQSDAEAEQIVASLLTYGFTVNALLEDETSRRLATVRLNTPPEDATPLLLDLLFATCGIEPEIVARATVESVFPALRMPIATVSHLLAMKVLASRDSREHDVPDIARLLAVATDADVTAAREALHLITERGFNRGKDLQADFAGYLARFRP